MQRTLVIAMGLALLLSPAWGDEVAPKPPDGWTERTADDGTFAFWLPEKTRRSFQSDRNLKISGQRMKITVLVVELSDDLTFMIEKLRFPAAAGANRAVMETAMREMLVEQVHGKLSEEKAVTLGATPGKEYLVTTGKGLVRARVFVDGSRLTLLISDGTAALVQGDRTNTFLDSFRATQQNAPSATGGAPDGSVKSKVYGGAFDAEFLDAAPEGGMLAGLELGLGKFGDSPIIVAARPVYRVGDEESKGEQYGKNTKNVTSVVAKPGYAVGAVVIKAGLAVDGMSLTFMKVAGDKLDPADSYESDWIGGKGGSKSVRIGGDGTPIIGVIGKSNNKDLTGIGMQLKHAMAKKKTKKKKS